MSPTIEEAKTQLEQQRQLLREQQQRAESARQALEQQRKSLPNIRTEQALRSGGLNEREKRRLVLSKERGIQEKQGTVSEYEQQLQRYEQEQLTPYEQQIKQAEIEQKAQQEAQDYNYALRVYLGQTSGSQIGRIDPEIRAAAQKAAESMESVSVSEQKLKQAGLKPVFVGEEFTGFEDTVKGMSIPAPNLGMGSAEDIKRYEKAGIIFQESPIVTKELSSLSQPEMNLMSFAPKLPEKQNFVSKLKSAVKISSTFVFNPLSNKVISRPILEYSAEKTKLGINKLSEITGKGYENMFAAKNIPTTGYIPTRNVTVSSEYNPFTGKTDIKQIELPGRIAKTPAGVVVSIAKETPHLLFFVPEAASDIILGTKGLRKEEIQKQKESTLKNIFETQATPQEGYIKATQEEINLELGSEVESEIKKQAKLQIISGGLVLGTIGAIKGGQYLFKPIVTRTGGKVIEPVEGYLGKTSAGEIVLGDKTYQYSQTIIKRSPVIEQRTNEFRKLFNLPVKEKVISPEKTNIIEVYGYKDMPKVIEYYKIGKKGKGVSNFGLLGDNSVGGLSAESVSQMGGKPEFLLGRLGAIKTKVPTPKEFVPKLFSEEEMFSVSKQQVIELARKQGRNTYLSNLLVNAREVKQLPSGTQIFEIEAIGKDISNPLSRRTGKTPAVIGNYFKFAPAPEKTGVKILNPANIDKTPLSKTFGLETKQVTQELPIVLPKKIPSTRLLTKPTSDIKVENLAASIQEPRTESVYAGTGMYERTEEYGTTLPKETSNVRDMVLLSQPTKEKTRNVLDVGLGVDEESKVLPKLDIFSRENNKIKEELKSDSILNVRLSLGQREITKQKVQPKQSLVQIPKVKQNLPKPPKPIKFKFNFEQPTSKEKLKEIGNVLSDYKVYVRNKGNDIEIGKFKTLSGARSKFITELKSTPAASGYILKGNKPLKFEELNLGMEFAPSKKDIFRTIQKKEKRMGTRSETKKIQYFKKKSGGFL